MITINTILGHLRVGRATHRESVAALARLITAENVADIMAALPEDVAGDVERWACTVPAKGGVVVGANLSSEEGQRIAESHELAARAVREWAARSGNRVRTGDYRVRFYVKGDTVVVDKIGDRSTFYED